MLYDPHVLRAQAGGNRGFVMTWARHVGNPEEADTKCPCKDQKQQSTFVCIHFKSFAFRQGISISLIDGHGHVGGGGVLGGDG